MAPVTVPASAQRTPRWACLLLACLLGGCTLGMNAARSPLLPVSLPLVRADEGAGPVDERQASYRAAGDDSAGTPPPPCPPGKAKGAAADELELPAITLTQYSQPAQGPANAKKSEAVTRKSGTETETGQEKAKEADQETQETMKAAEKHREPWYSVHEQGTIITQDHPEFRSPYVGPLSLVPHEPSATTETATVYLDVQLWHDGPEFVFNPEISGGRGLSNTLGVAGFPNGEATRVGAVEPTPYVARLLLRQTWNLGGPWEKLEDEANQIAGHRDLNRVTVSVGKMSATDVADNNLYSHDPRTQFMDWALMYNGAWDYPANVRGYTYGLAVDYNTLFYAIHYGIFAEPKFANAPQIDQEFLKAHGQILELEEHWGLEDNPGKLREWVFLNHAHMGNYDEAIGEMPVKPDVTKTRTYRFKYGFGFNLEQELTKELGAFAKLGWNDGHSESWAFTEIDRTAAVGVQLKGKRWHRPKDEVGVAALLNGLSGPHRDYLAHGGLGFIIGDGRLNYAPEEILEMYYNWRVVEGINVTVDVEGIDHPAYNADRGPVVVGSIRVHLEH